MKELGYPPGYLQIPKEEEDENVHSAVPQLPPLKFFETADDVMVDPRRFQRNLSSLQENEAEEGKEVDVAYQPSDPPYPHSFPVPIVTFPGLDTNELVRVHYQNFPPDYGSYYQSPSPDSWPSYYQSFNPYLPPHLQSIPTQHQYSVDAPPHSLKREREEDQEAIGEEPSVKRGRYVGGTS